MGFAMMNDEFGMMKRVFDKAFFIIHHYSLLPWNSPFGLTSLVKIRSPRIFHLSAFIILFFCVAQVQAAVSARLDRNQIAEGETVTLQIQVQGQSQTQPDTSPLTKDFDVLGVSSSSQVNIINGRMNALTTWNISLSPKRGGELEIPPLEVGSEQSQPLKLIVSDAPVASAATGGRPIFIETEVDRTDPYVQGMVRYTVKLYYSGRLLDAGLSPPTVDSVMLEQLVEDKQYIDFRNGQRYKVVERQYALFPQKSGSLKLPGVVLDAKILDPNARRQSPFGSIFGNDPFFGGAGGMARAIRLRGEAISLNVQPRPPSFKGYDWIPAESLVLTESWQPEDGDIRVGDPLNRTIIIQATGLKGEQLPELKPGNVKGFKIYPDKSKADSQIIGLGVSGTKSRSFAFVPTQAGQFTIPAVKLHWWDIKTNKAREAELPARTIEVLPAVGGQQVQIPSNPAQQPVPNQSPVENKPSVEVGKTNGGEQGQTVVVQESASFWPWSTLLFALMWLATFFLWLRGRGQQVNEASEVTAQITVFDATARQARNEFLAACKNNDAGKARKSLLSWAKAHWPNNPPKGLNELSSLLGNPQQAQLLKDLDSAVYSGTSQAWDGIKLAESLTRFPEKFTRAGTKQPLPALYQP